MSRPVYPPARRDDVVEDLFGVRVADPYRWLENSDDACAQAWAAEQDRLFLEHRAGWLETKHWASIARRVSSFGVSAPPVVRGPLRFVQERRVGDERARLLVVDADGDRRVLVDPVEIDPSAKTGLYSWWPSREGERVAIQLEVAEQPPSDILVLDVGTGAVVDGPLPRARNTSLAWLPGGDAFYYVARVPDEELAGGDLRLHRRVRLHRVGTPWQADVVVFGGEDAPDSYYGVTISAGGGHLAIAAMEGPASHNDVWVAELDGVEVPQFVKRIDGCATRARVLPRFLPDDGLLLITDHQAPCGRICIARLDEDEPGAWRTVVPEDSQAPLDDAVVLDDSALARPLLVVARTRHAVSELTLHDLASGRLLSSLSLPGAGTVSSLRTALPHQHGVAFSYCDFTTPPTVYRYDAATGLVEPELSTQEFGDLPSAA